ncbi:MAG: VCBS repeat-containing protein [Verrucomicrobia bacterium]|nr:MAG: VCBS repeat-containing protein [Verrucomicrobiota bacterium]
MGKEVLCFLGTALVKSPGVPAIVGVSAILANLLHHEPALADGCPEPSFAAARTSDARTWPISVAVGDFNGDGKPDLAVVGSANVSILLGKGDGTFQASVGYGAGTNPVSVAVGDVNGDGKLDLAVANEGLKAMPTHNRCSVSVLLGNGDGTFQRAVSYAAGWYPFCVAVGDLNGDGKPDLAVANQGGVSAYNGGWPTAYTNGSVSVLLGKGDGTFDPPVNYATGNYASSHSVAIGDFNGDGRRDLAVANYASYDAIGSYTNGDVSVLFGNGDGTFQPAASYVVGAAPGSLAAGDFNGDSKDDLAVGNSVSGTVSLLLGKDNGTFQAAVNYAVGANPSSVAVGDFNSDGVADLAIANGGSATVSVLLGKGDGTFQTAIDYSWGGVSVAVGDFDGDGQPDLAAANNANIMVLLGKGDGTFPGVVYKIKEGVPESLAAGDFNADGRLDLAVANYSPFGGNVSVLLGKGDGSFREDHNYNVGGRPRSVAIGDLNGDGTTDLAVANSVSISVLLGKGNGLFLGAVNYDAGTGPSSVAIGDLNGDGKPDLAVANAGAYSNDNFYANGSLSVLLGKGDGTFREAVNYGAGKSPRYVVMSDFNGDGKPDLAVANAGSFQEYPGDFIAWNRDGGVSVLLGKGDGTFETAITYDVGRYSYPTSVAVGDFNGDGKPDLAVSNGVDREAVPGGAGADGDGEVFVLIGKGDGSFETAVNYGSRWNFGSVVVDFNGDGKLDLALAGLGVSVLLGKGDGTFQAAVKYGQVGRPLAVGDFNGDGEPDLAVTTTGTSGVVILLNTCSSAGTRLAVARSSSNLSLSWPLQSIGFLLESTTNFNSTNWQPAVDVRRTNNGRLELTAPFDQPGRFFRLRKP